MCQRGVIVSFAASVKRSPGCSFARSPTSSTETSFEPSGSAPGRGSWGSAANSIPARASSMAWPRIVARRAARTPRARAGARARARFTRSLPRRGRYPRSPMAGRKRFSVVRDPVHGDVYLTHEELRLLDTREMQRLRGIKQLGTAYLVFPGATHTRFEHSIGSLHMAARM